VSHGPTVVTVEQRRQLLRFARQTARRVLENSSGDPSPITQPLGGWFGGVFVTFWSGRNLRGCVGTFAPTSDLAATIAEVTRSSLADARFEGNPITRVELPDLEIEISILSDPQPTHDPLSLIPGKHGVIVRRGERSGCFLPRVALERGWSAEQFAAREAAQLSPEDKRSRADIVIRNIRTLESLREVVRLTWNDLLGNRSA
jgi:uncharacterized protein (TIGR00296 family)